MRTRRDAVRWQHGPLALPALAVASLIALNAAGTTVAQASDLGDPRTAFAIIPAEPHRSDLAIALGATSDAVRERQATLVASRAALARARAGVSVVAQVAPGLEFERDLADPASTGAWETDIDVSLDATYRRDTVAILRARLAVATAEARLRDQLRDDLQRALLALSAERLDARALTAARDEADSARQAVIVAQQDGATEQELLPMRLAAELASVALERAQVEALTAVEARERLGLSGSVPFTSALLSDGPVTLADLSPAALRSTYVTVPTPERHSQATTLSLQFDIATAHANASAFSVLREIELYGAYENAGFEVESRVAMVTGVPLVGVGLSWTNGEDDVGFTVGLGATVRFTDSTNRDAAAATQAVDDARAAYAAFLDAQVDAELTARRAAELDYDEFGLLRLQQQLAEDELAAALAGGASEREIQRLTTVVRRSLDATERAWQRYVRSLVRYLGIVDATWRADVLEER